MKSNFPFSIFHFPLLSRGIVRTCSKKQKGFTLIELLVVISIIGVLAAIALVSFTGTQRQTRDTNRKSDLKQYQTSLGEFASKNGGLYPARAGGSSANIATLCGYLGISASECVNDPKYDSILGVPTYYYQTPDGDALAPGSATATNYVLWGSLENSGNFWVVCSNGLIRENGSAPSGNCPF